MIIFDTNILRGVTRKNPTFDILRALKHSGIHTIGVPWMVLEELVAKQSLEYAAAHGRASAAMNDLGRKAPWSRSAQIPSFNFERAKEYWRGQYSEVLQIIETSEQNAKEALAREAYCERPAKTNSDEKGGARDVAIWLSVIDYLKSNPNEEVFFVSKNTKDFGDGSEYPDLMARDLGDMKERLTILTSFEDIIGRFTEKIEVSDNKIKRLLEEVVSDEVAPVEGAANTLLQGGPFRGTLVDDWEFKPLSWREWALPPSAAIRNVSRGSGHKIGDSEWYTATVDWLLVGLVTTTAISYFSSTDVPPAARIACQWRTKILFSVGENLQLTIVEDEKPTALDANDRAELEPLIERGLSASADQTSPAMSGFISQFMRDISREDTYKIMLRLLEDKTHREN
jgi:hypothetical protein